MTGNLPTAVGTKDFIKLKNGKKSRVILLNNAATTPPFEDTLKAVIEFLRTYGAFHRGAGPHANLTYEKTHSAIQIIRNFIHAEPEDGIIFTQNTSAAINLFARMLRLEKNDVVITTSIEHTSNNLPWHFNTAARVVEINAFEDGSLDYDDLEKKAKKYCGRLRLISITGAANQTGYIPNIRKVADLAHRCEALLFVDAAQLAPHRPIDMKKDGIDALAFSAHKIYAPFGIGVLALPEKLLDSIPVDPGGGSIDMISEKDVLWAPPRERHQTGTWNVTGIVALGASCKAILDAGWNKILKHEEDLVKYMVKRLGEIPGITMYVPAAKYIAEKRIGTFPLNLHGYHHSLLSAILENEYGIETRAGTICNHRLVRRWFKIDDKAQKKIEKKIANGDRLASYGIVRASLAIHNTREDIDKFITALKLIATKGPRLKYKPVPAEEIYICEK